MPKGKKHSAKRHSSPIAGQSHRAEINQAMALQKKNRFGDAEAIYRKILAADINHVGANAGFGAMLGQCGHPQHGLSLLQKAVDLQPDNIDSRFNLAQCLRNLRRSEEALVQLETIIKTNSDVAIVFNMAGNIQRELLQHKEAEVKLLRAIKLEPRLAVAHNNLGILYIEQGKLEEGRKCIEKAMKLKPDYYTAFRNLTSIKKYTEYSSEIKKMESIYSSGQLAVAEKMELSFSLGKIFEDLKQYEKAFKFWHDGNQHHLKLVPYNADKDIAFLEAIEKSFSQKFFSSRSAPVKSIDITPVFIVSMPRSGSSLLEQILASHSEVYGAGELSLLDALVKTDLKPYPDGLEKVNNEQWRQMAEKHLGELDILSGGASFVIDKMPANFQHIGLIQTLFPNAKIINCLRDPMATGLSCFKHHFITSALGYSRDLVSLGRYYRQYQQLMSHWHKVFPDQIYDLQYEQLVENPEAEIRQLLDFCGLPFEEACLSSHQTKRMVVTASAAQVREPIHKNAIAHWKNFEAQLQPMKEVLEYQ